MGNTLWTVVHSADYLTGGMAGYAYPELQHGFPGLELDGMSSREACQNGKLDGKQDLHILLPFFSMLSQFLWVVEFVQSSFFLPAQSVCTFGEFNLGCSLCSSIKF